MRIAIETFRKNIERVKSLHGLHDSLAVQLTKAVDLSDMLRAAFVLCLSALDTYVHDLTLLERDDATLIRCCPARA